MVVDTSDSLFAFDLDEASHTTADLDEDGGTTADLDEGGHTTAGLDEGGHTAAELDEGGGGASAAPQPPTRPPCPRGAEGATEASEDTARRARNQARACMRALVITPISPHPHIASVSTLVINPITAIHCNYMDVHIDIDTDINTGIVLTRQVHVGSREFEHLRDYDMNALCARVVVVATRPGAGT